MKKKKYIIVSLLLVAILAAIFISARLVSTAAEKRRQEPWSATASENLSRGVLRSSFDGRPLVGWILDRKTLVFYLLNPGDGKLLKTFQFDREVNPINSDIRGGDYRFSTSSGAVFSIRWISGEVGASPMGQLVMFDYRGNRISEPQDVM